MYLIRLGLAFGLLLTSLSWPRPRAQAASAADLEQTGARSLGVVNPEPGGGSSGP